MKYGVFVPNFGDYFDVRSTAKFAVEAEEAGWDGFFIWDHLAHPSFQSLPFADPWITLTAVALATNKIHFGTMVTPVARRRPWKLAKETTTLDHLSKGRVIFGAGLGSHDVEFRNLGEETNPVNRGKMLDEGLNILSGLWSGEHPFTFEGTYYHINETNFDPPTVQQPRIPIWIGGTWPNQAPIQRAAKWDGYFPIKRKYETRFLSPREIEKARQMIEEIRGSFQDFDLIASGYTDQNGESEKHLISEYEAAGATWWIEALDPWRYTIHQASSRVRLGPPKS